MSFYTKPGYTATNQSVLSSYVPDDQDGEIAYCILEQTAWQLEKTSVVPLGPDAIATKSGTGRWVKVATGSSVPVSPNYEDVDLDFTSGPFQQTSVTVTVPATWVQDTMSFSFLVIDTATHTAEDAAIEDLTLTVLSIVNGVSFDLIGTVQSGTNGVYRVRVKGT